MNHNGTDSQGRVGLKLELKMTQITQGRQVVLGPQPSVESLNIGSACKGHFGT